MLQILILEDNPDRIRKFAEELKDYQFCIANTAATAIALLQNIKFQVVFLDHDLGGEVYVSTDKTNTGSEVTRHMSSSKTIRRNCDLVILHTMNKPGGDNMQRDLADTGLLVSRAPFVAIDWDMVHVLLDEKLSS